MLLLLPRQGIIAFKNHGENAQLQPAVPRSSRRTALRKRRRRRRNILPRLRRILSVGVPTGKIRVHPGFYPPRLAGIQILRPGPAPVPPPISRHLALRRPQTSVVDRRQHMGPFGCHALRFPRLSVPRRARWGVRRGHPVGTFAATSATPREDVRVLDPGPGRAARCLFGVWGR